MYLGDLPMMTERGTFVVNGVDRVVVSQLARSPGVYFNDSIDFSGRILYNATLIPSEGAWLEVETDANDVIYVRVGQTRKFPITTLLRALGAFDQARNFGYEFVPKAELLGRPGGPADRREGDRRGAGRAGAGDRPGDPGSDRGAREAAATRSRC